MIGLALSGGGSRAMAFHLGCLRALDDLEILDRVKVLSTISGGSVIGAYYAYTPTLTFDDFEDRVRKILRNGFHRKILGDLLRPQHFFPGVASSFLSHMQDALGLVTSRESSIPRFESRSHAFERVLQRELFPELSLSATRRNNLEIVIGACELRSGTAFRFGNTSSGSWRLGQIEPNDVQVSFATACSAAYPLFLPAIDRTFSFKKNGQSRRSRVCLTDGGVYDNLGIQVLEPGRNTDYSLHTFSCDTIIACNAGVGQDSGDGIPLGFVSRTKRAFEVVHRRVQDNAMHHLHGLKASGRLKGFVMPYLGQQDGSLPWRSSSLVPRDDVVGYPTDFATMPEAWIDRLSARGEELTRILISHYLPDL